jgi:hypothetical protein
MARGGGGTSASGVNANINTLGAQVGESTHAVAPTFTPQLSRGASLIDIKVSMRPFGLFAT